MADEPLVHEGRLDAVLALDPSRPLGFGTLPGAPLELLAPEAFRSVAALADAVGYREVELAGLEALSPRDRDAVLAAVAGLGWRTWLATPGVDAPAALLDALTERTPLTGLSVTVTGPDAERDDAARGAGAWERAWATATEAVARQVPVILEAIVLADTFDAQADLTGLVEQARDAGIAEVVFSRPVGPGARALRPSPEKARWFRAVLDAFALWDGYVSHRWHFKDLRPFGLGEEQVWDCDRIATRRLCVSARGFHPCAFLTDVVLAPLSDAEALVTSPGLRPRLDWFRAAAILTPGDPVAPGDAIQRTLRRAGRLDGLPQVFSCAECTDCFAGMVRDLREWTVAPGLPPGDGGRSALESRAPEGPR